MIIFAFAKHAGGCSLVSEKVAIAAGIDMFMVSSWGFVFSCEFLKVAGSVAKAVMLDAPRHSAVCSLFTLHYIWAMSVSETDQFVTGLSSARFGVTAVAGARDVRLECETRHEAGNERMWVLIECRDRQS